MLPPASPAALGLRQGLRAGLGLAGVYALLGLAAEVGRQAWLTHELRLWRLPLFQMGWASLLPFYGLLPLGAALVLGAGTGALIGELWARLGRRLDGRVFALGMLIICALIAAGLHGVFQIRVDFTLAPLSAEQTEWPANSLGLLVSYPFWAGVPSLLYAAAGAWGSYTFWRARRTVSRLAPA